MTTYPLASLTATGVSPISISAGGSHTCAVVSDGLVFCWGYNGFGQLGTGDTTDRLVPTAMGLGQGGAFTHRAISLVGPRGRRRNGDNGDLCDR